MTQRWRPNGHAAIRLKERYGLELTPAQLRDLRKLLVAGKGVLVDGANPDRVRRLITFEGQEIVVLWCPANQHIITALPKRNNFSGRGHRQAIRQKRIGKRPQAEPDFDEAGE